MVETKKRKKRWKKKGSNLMKNRCYWATKEEMHDYHDTNWGVPVYDDSILFEFLNY